MALTVLMVAEKPSIAQTLAAQFTGSYQTEKRGPTPVHQVESTFFGQPAVFRITSVTGHIYGLDFHGAESQDRSRDPLLLFDAPTVKKEKNPKAHMPKHLKHEAKRAHLLVLWLDCDREGENICFEVMENTVRHLQPVPPSKSSSQAARRRVYRAKFSALTKQDIARAMQSLGEPNLCEARAVDARAELDLRLGIAMTRFQSSFFHQKYGNLNSACLSYGPCQTPTLGAVVARSDEIASFQPEPFWYVVPTISTDMVGGRSIKLEWQRKRVFDQGIANFFREKVAACIGAPAVSYTHLRAHET